ncbi:MAG TPA: BTAD domain-containing putative transcriptional regulator, partial [Jatrophihabitantaceae bacterium]
MEPAAEDELPDDAATRAARFGERLDALLEAGHTEEMCDVIATAFARRADAADVPEVAALVSALPDSVLTNRPRVLLELARACEAEARVRLRRRLLERAARLDGITVAGFDLALEAELIANLASDLRADEVEARHAALAKRIDAAPDSLLADEARARSSHALGRVLSWRGDPTSMERAEDALQTAAGRARALGRREWRAQSLLSLGYGVYFERGEELRGRARLREAMDLLPVGHPRRAAIGTFLAEAMVRSHVGEAALPLLDELRHEASATGDQRALGYAAWIMALYTSERGDRAATLEWLAEAERHPGDWFEHSTGSEFLAEAAMSAERVGEIAVADRYLARALERCVVDGIPEQSWLATGMINSRRGDADLAIERLSALLDEPWFPPRDAWTARLHLALARLRSGDQDGAARDAARGLEAASALVGPGRAAVSTADLPAVLSRLEPDLVRRLGPLAAAAGSTLAAALQPATPRIGLFGGLSVSVGDTAVPVPPGKPAQLLILLAIVRVPVPTDVIIEDLWPEVSGEVGRRRIRNVLARVRATCGDLVVRIGEALSLAPGTDVDVATFETAAESALRADRSQRAALAVAALDLYRDDLVPEAAYAPRVLRLRDELAARAIELLELIADAATAAGRLDDAVAALARIADLDPYDESVLQRVIDLLSAAGRRDQAGVWTERM